MLFICWVMWCCVCCGVFDMRSEIRTLEVVLLECCDNGWLGKCFMVYMMCSELRIHCYVTSIDICTYESCVYMYML